MRRKVWAVVAMLAAAAGMQGECRGRVELKLSQVAVNSSQFFYYTQVLNKTDKEIHYDLSFASMGARGRIYNSSMKGFAGPKAGPTIKVGGGNSGFSGLPVTYDGPAGGGVSISNCTP